MFLNQACEGVVAQLAGSKGFHQDRYRFGHSDGVAQLHLGSFRQTSCYEAFRHIASGIGSRTVHLGGVLAGEGSPSMAGIATVGVHDDFAAGEPRIALGTADHEFARGVDQILG